MILALPALAAEEQPWVPLFNGKNLDGWTPKFSGHATGENFANTFRVEDGILKVSYDGYEKFDAQYGHLFTNIAYSHYILRMEYRFTGKMMADAPQLREPQQRRDDPRADAAEHGPESGVSGKPGSPVPRG